MNPGAVVGGFVLEARLGEGGFGEVWRARRAAGRDVEGLPDGLPEVVAIKLARDPARVTALAREGAILRRLDHPSVVRIHGIHPHAEPPHIVMDYVAGSDLGALLETRDHRRLDWRSALPIVIEVTEALAAAHAAGIVHGDLKPANVLIADEGDAILADFGLGQSVAGGGGASLATSFDASLSVEAVGSIRGTLAYMAPECRRGERVTPAADVYSLGVLVYELLLGRRPRGAWRPLAQQEVDAPPRLEALLRRLLDPFPGRRPVDAGAVLAELEAVSRDAGAGGEGGDGLRSCPADAAPLHPVVVHGCVLDRCRRCGGTWFDEGELEAVVDASAPAVRLRVEVIDGRVDRALGCPVCAGQLRRGELRVGRVDAPTIAIGDVEHCGRCGVYVPSDTRLDLIEVTERVARGLLGGAGPAVGVAPASPPPRPARRRRAEPQWWRAVERTRRKQAIVEAAAKVPGMQARLDEIGALDLGGRRGLVGVAEDALAGLIAVGILAVLLGLVAFALAGIGSWKAGFPFATLLLAAALAIGFAAPFRRLHETVTDPWRVVKGRLRVLPSGTVVTASGERSMVDLEAITVSRGASPLEVEGEGIVPRLRFESTAYRLHLAWKSGRPTLLSSGPIEAWSAGGYARRVRDLADAVAALGGPHVRVVMKLTKVWEGPLGLMPGG